MSKNIRFYKKPLKCYPFIESGIKIILEDKDIMDDYNKALVKYRELIQRQNDFNEDTELEKKDIALRLANSGKELIYMEIYNCSKFVDEDIVRIKEENEKKRKKRRSRIDKRFLK